MSVTTTGDVISEIQRNIERVLLGKPEAIRLAMATLLAGGHLLIEDAPGVGKTALAKALAHSLGCSFNRLQFTPDLLPSDIVGSSVYLPDTGDFEFREGPVFTNILLADEINRTPPRTQSALLEAMNETQVSVDGKTMRLPQPFFVLATQNPFEYEGTYALPENELDRFMLCIEIGYPDRTSEKEVLKTHRDGEPADRLTAVADGEQIRELHTRTRRVAVDDSINDYILDIVEATRNDDELALGVSTRGAITLYRAAQGYAVCHQRDYVVPDDVKELAVPALAHRVVCRGLMRENLRVRASEVIRRIVSRTHVPS